MASLLYTTLLCFSLSCIALADFGSEFTNYGYRYQPQNVGFDQSLSYSGGSSGSVPSSGSGSIPSVGGDPGSGSGSVPSSGGGYGSVPSTDPSYGGGSGSGSGSIDPGTGGVPTVPSVGGGIPTVPSTGGGIPTVPSTGGGIPNVPSTGGGIPTVPSGGGFPTVPSTGGASPTSGCSCDFWAAHVNSWPDPLQFISTVSAIFGGLASNTFGPRVTLIQALQDKRQDPYSQLLRQGTAAMLNSYAHPHFQYTPQAVRTHFNAALVSAQAAAVQATKFANANRGYGTNTFCT